MRSVPIRVQEHLQNPKEGERSEGMDREAQQYRDEMEQRAHWVTIFQSRETETMPAKHQNTAKTRAVARPARYASSVFRNAGLPEN
ncbi:unnamed protein product, partial [Durusdinium trenchii]